MVDIANGDKKVEISEKELNALKELQTKFPQLQEQFNSVTASATELQKKNNEYEALFGGDEKIREYLANGKNISSRQNVEQPPTNFDEFTPSQTIAHMRAEYQKLIDNLNKNVEDRFNKFDDSVALGFARLDVRLTDTKYSDEKKGPTFKSLQKDIYEKSKTNPSWSAEKCYEEVVKDVKLKDIEAKAIEDKKIADAKNLFTEKGGISKDALTNKNLDGVAAAKAALDSIGGLPKDESSNHIPSA